MPAVKADDDRLLPHGGGCVVALPIGLALWWVILRLLWLLW